MSDEQYRSVSNSLKPYGTQLREKRLVELRLQELHTQMLAWLYKNRIGLVQLDVSEDRC